MKNRKVISPASTFLHAIDDWISEAIITGQLIGAVRRDLPIELLLSSIWSTWDTIGQWQKQLDMGQISKETVGIMIGFLQRILQDHAGEVSEEHMD